MINENEIIATCCFCNEDIFEDEEYRSSNCGDYYYHLGCNE